MQKLARRAFMIGAGGAAGWAAASRFGAKQPVLDGTQRHVPLAKSTHLDDASGLSATPVHKHLHLHEDPGPALVKAVRAELRSARADGRRSISARRATRWGDRRSPATVSH